MHPDMLYFSILLCLILLCLMPDDFTHQVESAATQLVKLRFPPGVSISLSHRGLNPPFLVTNLKTNECQKSKRCENNFSNI